jgi:CelD/BcsL family acetyltransferase involved in cellulose biosynthesis
MLSFDVLRPGELGRAELDAWLQLQAARPDLHSPFLSPGWAMAVERAQGPGVKVVLISEQGRLRGVFAACVGRFTAWPVGAPLCDLQALVAEPGLKADPRAIVRALGVRRFDFTQLLGSDTAFAPCVQGAQQSYVIDVSSGWEAWIEARKAAGSGLFKDLGKKRRRLERAFGPLRFTALSRNPADLDQLMAWKSQKFVRTRQTDLFAAGWPRALMHDLLQGEREGADGGLFTLHAGDRLIAAHLTLVGADVINGWINAHDDGAEEGSPGLLLFEDLIRWMDGRYRELDVGPVDYGYKSRFTDVLRPTGHGFVGDPSAVTFARAAAYGVRRVAERLPLGRASAWPGKAMRRLDLLRALNVGAGPAGRPELEVVPG